VCAARAPAKRAALSRRLQARWQRLAADERWLPFRLTKGGDIAPFESNPMTTSGRIYDEAFPNDFTDRYSFAEIWATDPDRGWSAHTPWISTFVRDNRSGDILAEVKWRKGKGFRVFGRDGYVDSPRSEYARPESARLGSELLLKALLERQSGYADAAAYMRDQTADAKAMVARGSFDPSREVRVRGLLEKQGNAIVYTPSASDGVYVTGSKPRRVVDATALGSGRHELRLARNEVLALAGVVMDDGWNPDYKWRDYWPDLKFIAWSDHTNSGNLPSMRLHALRSDVAPGSTVKVSLKLPPSGQEQTLDIVVAEDR
jgi:hypothetical protein